MRTQSRRRELAGYAAGLVVAAILYVAFAALRQGFDRMALESLGVAVFSLAAIAGLRAWPALIGVAWIAHGAWDLLLHPPNLLYVPSWYPAWCLGFDWVVGFYILRNRRALGALE